MSSRAGSCVFPDTKGMMFLRASFIFLSERALQQHAHQQGLSSLTGSLWAKDFEHQMCVTCLVVLSLITTVFTFPIFHWSLVTTQEKKMNYLPVLFILRLVLVNSSFKTSLFFFLISRQYPIIKKNIDLILNWILQIVLGMEKPTNWLLVKLGSDSETWCQLLPNYESWGKLFNPSEA